jgi:hypothetical protein
MFSYKIRNFAKIIKISRDSHRGIKNMSRFIVQEFSCVGEEV